MRTILFIFFLLLLWCGFSSFESTSVRPNGWYYVIDMEHDSLSADPIVTVKDFKDKTGFSVGLERGQYGLPYSRSIGRLS